MNDVTVTNEKSMANALIEIVARKDIDPERLEKFLDLQFKLDDRQTEKSFNRAMSNFQGECPIVTRHKKVDFTAKSGNKTKYDYAPLDEIIHVVKPILSKYGLSYSFDVEIIDASKSKLITIISHIDGHSKNYNHYFNPLHDDQRMNQAQREKSSLSYAKRAGLENALGIITQGEDDDSIRTNIDIRDINEEELKIITKLCLETKTDVNKMIEYINKVNGNMDDYAELKEITNVDYKHLLNQLNLKMKNNGGKK